MVVDVVGAEKLFEYFLRIGGEFVFSDQLSVDDKALFENLITVFVIELSFLVVVQDIECFRCLAKDMIGLIFVLML